MQDGTVTVVVHTSEFVMHALISRYNNYLCMSFVMF